MRINNSIKNTITSFIANMITIMIGLIAQGVFIKILGTEYLGINGLFTNIVSMLGIVELGIGSAIIYNLYKPIAQKDQKTTLALMNFYKKAYHIVAVIVFLLGILLIPFLGFFIEDITVPINIKIVYLLFIIDITCSYLLSYKRSILYADQKNYIINLIHMIYLLALNIIQLIILYLTKNYYLYLIIKIILRILENIVITIIANKKYEYLKGNKKETLDKTIEKDIFQKVKALFFHKIGGYIVSGTDNIMISKFLGVITVGLYSNYYMIINAVQTIFGQAISALTPSVGNMLVTEEKEKCFQIFQRIRFLNFWIATFSSISILVIIESFIKIWIGKEYILPQLVLIVLVLNFYQTLMRNSYTTFKEAAGIFYEDRYVPLIESLLNIVASILLLKVFGLAGVFMGTIISGLVLWCYSYPKYVYKKLFERDYLSYTKETLGYILLFILITMTTYFISIQIKFSNLYLEFFKNIIICLIIPNLILILLFFKTDHFRYYFKIIRKLRRR